MMYRPNLAAHLPSIRLPLYGSVFAFVAILAGASLALMNPSTGSVLVVAIGFVLVGSLALKARISGRLDPFEPLVFFAVAYGVMFVVRPAAILASGRVVLERWHGDLDITSTFDRMLVVALVGAIAFAAGYLNGAGAVVARAFPAPPGPVVSRTGVVIGALAVASIGVATWVVLLLANGGLAMLRLMLSGRSVALDEVIQQSSKYLWHGPWLLIPASLAVLTVARAGRDRVLLTVGLVLLALVLVWAVPLGSRMMLLPLCLGFLVYEYLARGRRPGATTLALAVIGALFVSSTLLISRNAQAQGHPSFAASATQVVRSPSKAVAPLTHGDDAAMAPLLAGAMTLIPNPIHETYGRAVFGDLLIRPIPRQLWAGKPLPPRERLVALLYPNDPSVNPEFSVLLYPYLDFGFAGVAIALFAFGVGARALYAYFLRYSHVMSVRLIFAVSLSFVIIGLRDSPIDTFARAMFVVAPFWFIFSLGSERLARGHRRASGIQPPR